MERLYRSRPGDAEAAERGDVNGAKSFFHKAIAQSKHLSLLGVTDVDNSLKKQALGLIMDNPLQHIKMIPLFMWRGTWSFGHPDPVQPAVGGLISVLLNMIAFVSLLILPLVALIKRDVELFALGFVSWAIFMFYAFFTHFIPRYSAPLIPIAIISTLLLIQVWLKNRIN